MSSELCNCGHRIETHGAMLGSAICRVKNCACGCFTPVEDPKEPRLYVEWIYDYRAQKWIGSHDGNLRYSIEKGQSYTDSVLLFFWIDDDNCDMLARVKLYPNLVGCDIAGFLKSYAENHLNNTDYFKRKAKS